MLFLSVDRPICVEGVGIELRLDLCPHVDVGAFLREATGSVMLTLRGKGSEALIRQLLDLEPAFFDLEYDLRPAFLREVIGTYRKTQFVLSYHNFEGVPADLEEIYLRMREYEVFSYKMAVMTHSTNEALRMLLFAKTHPKVSMICMGEAGRFARVLGPIVGNLVDYACLDVPLAPGQLTLAEWREIYRYSSLNRQTEIYGLIGDPVEKSPGHLYHNGVFREKNWNAVYVKMRVRSEELAEFMFLASQVGIRGLSVTIPLKEQIVPFLNELEPIGAINTLLFEQGKVRGINTDGRGALDAIEKKGPVRGKRVVLLGAGGAARAIAFEAKARGAEVWVLNRTVQRAKELGCQAGGLDEIPGEYDILVNCLPEAIPIKHRANTVAMDVVYSPRETPFLQEAALQNCALVYGEEMFLNQAVGQTAFWREG